MNYQEFSEPENVALGDGRVVKALGSGSVRMNMLFQATEATEPKRAVLYNVLYVPKLTCNLFSVRAAVSMGNAVEIGPKQCCIYDENGELRGIGSLADKLRLYQLDCQVASVASSQGTCSDLWHQRLGHVHESRLKKCVESRETVQGINIQKMTELSFCEGCLAGKMCRKPFSAVGEIRSIRKLQLVHSDVCGPMHTHSIGGAKYFVTFIDDYTRCCAVYFMKHKSEVFDKFKEFEATTTNEVGKAIGTKTIQTNQNAVTTTGDEEQEGETKKSEDMPQVARQSERTRKAPVRYGYDEYADTSTHRVHHVAYHLCEVDEPTTLQEAMSSEHAAE